MIRSVTCCSYYPEKKWVAIGFNDRTIEIKDIFSQSVIIKISDVPDDITCCSFSHTNNLLLVGLRSGNILFISTQDWKRNGTLRGNSRIISHLKVSPNQNVLFFVLENKHLFIYSISEKKFIDQKSFKEHVQDIVFPENSNQVIIGFREGLLYSFSLNPFSQKIKLYSPNKVNSISLSNNGEDIAVVRPDNIDFFSLKNTQYNPIDSKNTGGIVACQYGKDSSEIFFCNCYGQVHKLIKKDNTWIREEKFSSSFFNFFTIWYAKNDTIIGLDKTGKIITIPFQPPEVNISPINLPDIFSPSIPIYESICQLSPVIESSSSPLKISDSQFLPSELCPISPLFSIKNDVTCSLPPRESLSPVTTETLNQSQIIQVDQTNLQLPLCSIVNEITFCLPSSILNVKPTESISLQPEFNSIPENRVDISTQQIIEETILPSHYVNESVIGISDLPELLLLDQCILSSQDPESKTSNDNIQIVPTSISPPQIIDYALEQKTGDYQDLEILPLSTSGFSYSDNFTKCNILEESIREFHQCNLIPYYSFNIPLYSNLFDQIAISEGFSGVYINNQILVIPIDILPRIEFDVFIKFNINSGVYAEIANIPGNIEDILEIIISSPDKSKSCSQEIYSNYLGIIDNITISLPSAEPTYNILLRKNKKIIKKEMIPCFQGIYANYLIFIENGDKLLETKELPPEEIILVTNKDVKISHTSSTIISDFVLNWPDYHYYIIPFNENNLISITIDGIEKYLTYSLIKKPILVNGTVIEGLPLNCTESFYSKLPDLLLPISSSQEIFDWSIDYSILFDDDKKIDAKTNFQVMRENRNYFPNYKMGYVRLDLKSLFHFSTLNAGTITLLCKKQHDYPELKFYLVPNLKIIFQPENRVFYNINSESSISIEALIEGPDKISGSNFTIISKGNSFIFRKIVTEKELKSNSHQLITIAYNDPKFQDAVFTFKIEYPIIYFKLSPRNQLPQTILPEYENITDITYVPKIIPLELLSLNKYHINLSVILPHFLKGSVSLVLTQPNNQGVKNPIKIQELWKSKNRENEIIFNLREFIDAISETIIFPINIQLHYRVHNIDQNIEQFINLLTIIEYQINNFYYEVFSNYNKQEIFSLSFNETGRLSTKMPRLMINGVSYDSVRDAEEVVNFNIPLNNIKNQITTEISIYTDSSLMKTYNIILSSNISDNLNTLFTLGCWEQILTCDNNFQQYNNILHLNLLYNYLITNTTKDNTNVVNVIFDLFDENDQESDEYDSLITFLTILSGRIDLVKKQSILHKFRTTKHVNLYHALLGVYYSNNQEFLKAKAEINLLNFSDKILLSVYISHVYEKLGFFYHADQHFFNLAICVYKESLKNNPYYLPFWIGLRKNLLQISQLNYNLVLSLCDYMIVRLIGGSIPITIQEKSRIVQMLES